MTTGQRIRAARKAAGLTQAELAKILNIPFQGISQWERDVRNPKYKTLQNLANALGVEWTDLVPEEEQGNVVRDHAREVLGAADKAVAAIEQEIEESCLQTDAIVALISLCVEPTTSKKLINNFLALNSAGQEKAVERVEELTEIPKYQAQKPPETDE